MKYCSFCGDQYPESTEICEKCGTKLSISSNNEIVKYCRYCRAYYSESTLEICEKCGTKLSFTSNNEKDTPKGTAFITVGIILWLLQILSIIGNSRSPLYSLSGIYGIGYSAGRYIAGIIGTILIIIGVAKRAHSNNR